MILDLVKLILEYSEKLVKGGRRLTRARTTGYSTHDLEIIDEFYRAFERPAFSVPFEYEVPGDLLRAIDDTILTLSTGMRRTREGQIIAKGKGKSELKSPFLRARFDAVSALLQEFRYSFDLAVATNNLRFVGSYVVASSLRTNRLFDELRNRMLAIMNPVFQQAGKPLLRPISSEAWKDVDVTVTDLSEEARRFYQEVLGRTPPMFPQKTFRVETTADRSAPLLHSPHNAEILVELRRMLVEGRISEEAFEDAQAKITTDRRPRQQRTSGDA